MSHFPGRGALCQGDDVRGSAERSAGSDGRELLSVFRRGRIAGLLVLWKIIFSASIMHFATSGVMLANPDSLRYVFHRNPGIGSHAQIHPLSVILNMGYDITQLDRYRKDILTYPYAPAASTVFGNLVRPASLVREYGFWRFLRHEVLPLEFNTGASWWPNYQLHLIGGGASWARLAEWFDARGVSAPGWWAAGTVMAGHLLNEVMENNAVKGRLIDPIADIYLFDLGGIALFSSEDVRRFFGESLHLADWSLQPALLLSNGHVHNAGQYFSVRLGIPGSERWSLLYVFGLNGLLGASVRLDNGDAISLAAGLRTKQLHAETENPLRVTADLTWSGGLYWDREGSLLASFVLSGISSNLLTANVYPGVFRIGGISPGCFITVTTEGRIFAGINSTWGIGAGW
ncbi:MAG: hypothetical protein M5R41_13140 [Bacteroidia bacterium]|nr:hypothetical protein [Bacteroidia bacterium]